MNTKDLEAKALWVRQHLWKMTMKLQRGHLASCYSYVDILVALYYGNVLRYTLGEPSDPARDRIIISKGHATAALYPIFADIGYFPLEELEHYGELDGLLGVFANTKIPGIEAVSDSLGHGLGIGTGMALAAKRNNEKHRVFVILGDAECNEGSVWESAAFAGHYNLDNLIVIVDNNHLGILGSPIGLQDFDERWRSCDWYCITANGHSFENLSSIFKFVGKVNKPLAIIANTIKGKGVSFMEGEAKWHNKIPNKEQQRQGRRDLGMEK